MRNLKGSQFLLRFLTAERNKFPNAARNIPSPLGASVKKTTQRTICYIKTEKEKQNNEQPTHKTAHLQAPTHKPMLRLAKELFSCRRTHGYKYLWVFNLRTEKI